jgi:hypothetical protein
VAVEHRLVRVGPGVEHQAVRAAGLGRDAAGEQQQVDRCLRLGFGEAPDVGLVHARDDQHVGRGLRVDVRERDRVLGLGHDVARDVPGHDGAEQAVVTHGPFLPERVLDASEHALVRGAEAGFGTLLVA